MGKPNSAILVTVDCLRADHVGFLGYGRPTTPFLDSLASESTVFTNAIVAGAPTYYSFPSIMASRYPLALGRDVIGLAPEEATIASTFAQMGYSTAAFVAANPYLSTQFGYDFGFDLYRDFLDAKATALEPTSELNGLGRSDSKSGSRWQSRLNRRIGRASHYLKPLGHLYDELYFQYCQRKAASTKITFDKLRRFPSAEQIVDHACEWLDSVGDSTFFLWLHFMDPHSPYYPKQKALGSMGREDLSAKRAVYLNSYWNRGDVSARRLAPYRQDIVALYDAGIRHVDEQVARLVRKLKALNQWQDCSLALTADHGEEFLEHGGRYHSPSKTTEELIHVPLLMKTPGQAAGVENAPFSLVNLAPTLLESAGVPRPKSFQGKSYLSAPIKEAAITECVIGCTNPFRPDKRAGGRILSVRESRFKMVFDMKAREEALYDLDADREENRPVPESEQRTVRRRLLEIAKEHLTRSIAERDFFSRLKAKVLDVRLALAADGNNVAN